MQIADINVPDITNLVQAIGPVVASIAIIVTGILSYLGRKTAAKRQDEIEAKIDVNTQLTQQAAAKADTAAATAQQVAAVAQDTHGMVQSVVAATVAPPATQPELAAVAKATSLLKGQIEP